MRRRFNDLQKAALLKVANYRCERCGTHLSWANFHADHITPYSKGGKTTLKNGAALCSACNLKKGDRKMKSGLKPLPWQTRNLGVFSQSGKKDYILVAGPATGKTAAAVLMFEKLLAQDPRRFMFVVVPNRSIKRGWAKWCSKAGLLHAATAKEIAADVQAVITTYAGAPSLLRWVRDFMPGRMVLIFDEFHHMEINNTWARPFVDMDESQYDKRIFLSGTPWRENGTLDGIVPYDENGLVMADYVYTYGENVNANLPERNTVDILFCAVDTTVKVTRENIETGQIETAIYDTRETRKSDSISPFVSFNDVVELVNLEGAMTILAKAVDALDEIRKNEVNRAAGIVFVSTREAAEAVASVLESRFGKSPIIVTSDDPRAHQKIEDFDRSHDEWIVAIEMISEGTDIPRIKVVADLSNAMTMMSIIQRWFRAVRLIRKSNGEPGHNTAARIFYINHALHDYIARNIEDDVRKHQRKQEDTGDGEGPPEPKMRLLGKETVKTDDPSYLLKGRELEANVVSLANWLLSTNYNGIQSSEFTIKQALNMARLMFAENIVPDDFLRQETENVCIAEITDNERKQHLKEQIKKLRARIGYQFFGGNFRDANKYIAEVLGAYWTQDNKTTEQLEKQLEELQEVEDGLR